MQNIVDTIIFPFLSQEQQQEKLKQEKLEQEKLKQEKLEQEKLEQKQQQETLNQKLLQAIKDKKDLSIIKKIVKEGADVKCKDELGKTPLHNACLNGHSEIVMLLIDKGADVNCKDEFGKTPIQVAVKNNRIAVINILFELGADVLVLNQEFINKYNEEIKSETKDLIAKITQAKNIKKRDEALKSKKDALMIEQLQERINTLASKITEINPRFFLKPQDLQEIKYIQDNPELNDYYTRMQKSFNEAFLFATIVSQGGTTIEENSRIANNIEKMSELLGDIPFASLILSQIKHGATAISKAKTIGKQANFSDIIFTADPIESSLFSERIARRFTISRELNVSPQHQITPNKSQIKDKSRMDEMKIYLKEQARKFGKKYLKLSQNLERGFLGQELSPTNQLALIDFEKAIEFIFNEGIDETIRKTRDETERHQAIIKEIITNSIALEVKEIGDFVEDQKNEAKNLEQNPDKIPPQIQLQLEEKATRIDMIENARPSSISSNNKAICCAPISCVVM